MIVFISMPMRGKSEAQIDEEMARLADKAHKLNPGAIMIDGRALQRAAGVKHQDIWLLSKAVEALSSADAAYFADEWAEARGCGVEHEICLKYGIEILHD